ncbi:hypothetical protein FGIG_01118 [Fasciola gigantica]|uniref:Schwannomin interacting protein 1 C-terminal domain-containing protein n=1 Tax=Fasciola gigantica TaxID=46835 RepID=A0A504YI38_FASGI|nr:hypothetical protein FGIG_01118 [Fasciola gigantica]
MTSIGSEVHISMFGLPLKRMVSLPTEWQRSRTSIRASSVEQLSKGVPHSNSATSSGYWEDYESVGHSAHDNVDSIQLIWGRNPQINRSCYAVHTSTWSPNAVKQVAETASPRRLNSENHLEHKRTKLYYQNTFGSFEMEQPVEDEEDNDRQKSPGSVMKRIPAPTIQMNLSTELQQSGSQLNFDLINTTEDVHPNLGRDSAPADRILPRQNSAPIPTNLLSGEWDQCGLPRGLRQLGRKPETKKTHWCTSCDTSESDDDGCDYAGERPEPRTLFEAALRRARLADSQREVNMSTGNKTGRAMPDWGSPIQLNRQNLATLDGTSEKKLADTSIREHDAKAPNSPHIFDDHPDRYFGELDSAFSDHTGHHLNRADSPETLIHPGNLDWCTGIENWLNNRPQWLYKTQTDSNAFQLCFFTNSEIDMQSENSINTCVCIPEEPVKESTKRISWLGSNNPDSTSAQNSPNYENSKHGQLFRDVFEFSEVNSRLEKAEQYCDLYFKQRSLDCTSPESLRKMIELQEKCEKTQREVHFSLSQASKIAHMQLELEKTSWRLVSPKVAKMLKTNLKPRCLLSMKMLAPLSCSQLQLIVNDILNEIQNLNTVLMNSLVERDELHLEHGAKLTDLDDLLAYLKELCIRVSIRRYRRQNSLNYAGDNFTPEIKSESVHAVRESSEQASKRLTEKTKRASRNPSQSWGTQSCGRWTLRQRLASAFSRQNSTTC